MYVYTCIIRTGMYRTLVYIRYVIKTCGTRLKTIISRGFFLFSPPRAVCRHSAHGHNVYTTTYDIIIKLQSNESIIIIIIIIIIRRTGSRGARRMIPSKMMYSAREKKNRRLRRRRVGGKSH